MVKKFTHSITLGSFFIVNLSPPVYRPLTKNYRDRIFDYGESLVGEQLHQQRRIQYRDFFPRQRNRAIVKGLSSVATVYMTSDGKGNFFDTWNEVH